MSICTSPGSGKSRLHHILSPRQLMWVGITADFHVTQLGCYVCSFDLVTKSSRPPTMYSLDSISRLL